MAPGPVKRLDGENIEPRAAIDECLGDEDVADGRRAEHQEGASSDRALRSEEHNV